MQVGSPDFGKHSFSIHLKISNVSIDWSGDFQIEQQIN